MIGGGFLGGGISIVPAGKAIIYASLTTEDGANIPNAVFKAVRTGSTVTANGTIDGRAELLVDAGHTYTVTVTPAGGSYLNNSQTVATASTKSYAVKFYLYPAKANDASTTASLNALNTSISTHAGRTDNPHAVTKAQVGLGAYPTLPADIGISTATQTALDGKAEKASTDAHINNKSNPHAVTKAQVGLSNVDNTSDAAKPISTATQTALDGKVSKTGDTMTGKLNLNGGYEIITGTENVINVQNTNASYDSETLKRMRCDISLDSARKEISRAEIYVSKAGELNRSTYGISVRTYDAGGATKSNTISIHVLSDGTGYSTTKMRSSPGVDDIVNKGYLDTRLSPLATDSAVVHKTGNESIAGIKTFTDNINIGVSGTPKQLSLVGNLNIQGDIVQNGSAYETHSEKLYTKNDFITLRDGAVSGLTAGATTGLSFKKYDGTNDGELSVDSEGTARVGDVGDLQPLATRNEAGLMTNNQPVVWDSSGSKMVTRELVAGDIPGLDAGKIISGTIADARIPSGITRDTELTAHTSRTDNPHSVTKAQVGLSNVDNTSDIAKPISTAQAQAIGQKADSSALTGHTGNTSNPHNVTKAQVGLSNVNNTSDANKPISTATQTALDAKADLPTWTYGSGTLTTNAGTCGYNYAYSVIGDVVTMRFTVGPSVDTLFTVPLPISISSASVQCIGIADDARFWVDYNGTSASAIGVNRAQTTVQSRTFHMLVIGQPSGLPPVFY